MSRIPRPPKVLITRLERIRKELDQVITHKWCDPGAPPAQAGIVLDLNAAHRRVRESIKALHAMRGEDA